MTTARDVIRSAVEELGEYSPGETIDADDADRGLAVLNDLMSMWSNEDLACFAMKTQSFPLVVGQGAYSIGPTGADITSVRPLRIEQAWQIDPNGNRYHVEIVDQVHWNYITNQQIEGGTPTVMMYDAQMPRAIINLWPVPGLAWTCGFMSYLQLDGFPNLTDDIILPVGYVAALKKNLAIDLAPFFNRNPLPITIELAARYLGNLKRKNLAQDVADFDSSALGNGNGLYNIYTDTFGRGY